MRLGLQNLITNEEGKMELKDACHFNNVCGFSTATQKLESIGYTEVK